MDARKIGAAAANINSFEPPFDFVQEEDCDTLLLYLPGFGKEQLRVQLARSGVLKISGTRPLGDNKWSTFQKDFPVSANCDTARITAKFEEGILYVRQPKVIVPAQKEENRPAVEETPAVAAAMTTNSNNQEKATAAQKTTPPVDHREAKDEQKSSEPSEVTNKLDKRNHNAPDKAAAAHGKVDAGLTNKVDDGAQKLHDAKIRQPSAELKVARQKMTVVLVALFAFVLGMWIRNLQGWFSHPAEE